MSNRTMEDKLKEAVDRRIGRENDFIEELISQINLAISTLAECDPSNARTAIDLTQQQLTEIIFKLNDVTNMTDKTASIANIVKDKNLMRRPLPISPPASALPIPSSTVPSSDVPPRGPLGPIVNPPGAPSNGRNPPLPIRNIMRGGKRTRRFRKK